MAKLIFRHRIAVIRSIYSLSSGLSYEKYQFDFSLRTSLDRRTRITSVTFTIVYDRSGVNKRAAIAVVPLSDHMINEEALSWLSDWPFHQIVSSSFLGDTNFHAGKA